MCLINSMVKYTRRRMTRRRGRGTRRAGRKTNRRVIRQGKLYRFKRTCQIRPWYFNGADWVQATINVISNALSEPFFAGIFKFKLEDLPNYTDFTQLYEQFKITGVSLRFIPWIGTENSGLTQARTDTLAYCIDRGANDLVTVSPSFNSLLENQDVKLRNSQRPFKMWIGSPVAHQGADAQVQVVNRASPWLDAELASRSTIVDHHGVKFSFPANVANDLACYYKVFATYYITCRNPQ